VGSALGHGDRQSVQLASKCPQAIRIPSVLREAHELLGSLSGSGRVHFTVDSSARSAVSRFPALRQFQCFSRGQSSGSGVFRPRQTQIGPFSSAIPHGCW